LKLFFNEVNIFTDLRNLIELVLTIAERNKNAKTIIRDDNLSIKENVLLEQSVIIAIVIESRDLISVRVNKRTNG